MARNLVLSYSQKREYRISLPNTDGPGEESHVISNAVQEACLYLSSNNLYGVNLESIQFTIEEN
jgi:hypothetical protein